MNTVLPTPRRALIDLDERRRRLMHRAEGRVLDVSDHSADSLAALAETGERFDTVVSALQISTARDALEMCSALSRLMDEGGHLLFLEPTAVVGAVGAVQHALGPWVQRATGRRPDYDIPAVLRSAGLLICDCERFTVRALWPYRSFVEGVARHPYPTFTPEAPS